MEDEQSLHQLLTTIGENVLDYSKPIPDMKTSLIDNLVEYKAELETRFVVKQFS